MILLTTFLTICFNNVKAQTPETQFTPEHLHAAERVIDATDAVQNIQKIFEAVIEKQAAQVSEEKRAAFVDVMHKFFGKYGTDEQIKKRFHTHLCCRFQRRRTKPDRRLPCLPPPASAPA